MQRSMSYAVACAWTFASTALLLVIVQASTTLAPARAHDLVQLGAWEALIYVLACFGVLRVHAPERPARDALGLRLTHPALLLFGVALGLSLHAPAESLQRLVERVDPVSEVELIQRATLLSPSNTTQAVLLVLIATCVVPLVEELFFRGALYTTLRKSHPLPGAAALTAVCFVLSHPETRTWLPFIVVSGAMTHLRAASGSMLPPLALHVSFNAVTIAAALTGASNPASPAWLPLPVIVAGWLVSLGLVLAVQYVSQRSPEAERARAEDADDS
ncbi:MAG TPA: CPBP family intramembrane glutamic endopeptidase [Polyangiaceae bacterium]